MNGPWDKEDAVETIVVSHPGNDDEHLFEPFVREWLFCNDPFKAALIVCPNNTSKSLRISVEWPQKEEIIKLRSQILLEEGKHAFLPTKDEFAKRVLDVAENTKDGELKLEGYELFAKIMGYIEKPSVQVDARTMNVTNKVMVVRDHGSDDDWERRTAEQQARLASTAN